jgi:hypothetical protein
MLCLIFFSVSFQLLGTGTSTVLSWLSNHKRATMTLVDDGRIVQEIYSLSVSCLTTANFDLTLRDIINCKNVVIGAFHVLFYTKQRCLRIGAVCFRYDVGVVSLIPCFTTVDFGYLLSYYIN